MKSVSISEFQKGVLKHISLVSESGQPVSIAIDGKPAAVLVGMETYEKMVAHAAILKILLQGEMDIGSGVGYSMEKVMQEAAEIEQEWAAEANQRQEAIERGESHLLPLDAVPGEFRSRLSRDESQGPETNAVKRSPFDIDGVKTQAFPEDISQAIAESRASRFRDYD